MPEYSVAQTFLRFWQIRTKTPVAGSSLRQHDSAARLFFAESCGSQRSPEWGHESPGTMMNNGQVSQSEWVREALLKYEGPLVR